MTQPRPLGPDSLTWKYFGDWRGLLIALWAGSMQNMHPELGAGVEEHSRFFEERWQRLFRSLYPIGGVIYDGPRARQTALEVRGYHDRIKGVDKHGRRYHALNPDTFYWAHSTFFVSAILIADNFCGGIGEAEKRKLFDEHVQWYEMYGMSMRPVPESWEDFQLYWKRMCEDVLEDNKATRDVLEIQDIAKPHFLPWLPDFAWNLVRGQVARNFVWLTVGLYDPPIRERLGYTWTERDERRHRRVGKLINAAFKLVPRDRRYHPRARAGWRRERGGLAPDAPLVETPARNLPPLSERGKPEHYSPNV
ncbi:oxygenase MpaB family protein [Amycolatopsis sp. EV170708-02-1]|uniref:oxygenase MpaB family protein n=1 Tax=Amycolatopsis sp. EV170708-02-1 TaxID=2919322 RepID=UPI001F0C58B6|nr:oxygenase MpaB family protein [Amycolatopsis sp. EV170708-02-1]UMP05108.1 oxygenase MpaB family protein [Amycolatopsis sp. EV170708-02-1]